MVICEHSTTKPCGLDFCFFFFFICDRTIWFNLIIFIMLWYTSTFPPLVGHFYKRVVNNVFTKISLSFFIFIFTIYIPNIILFIIYPLSLLSVSLLCSYSQPCLQILCFHCIELLLIITTRLKQFQTKKMVWILCFPWFYLLFTHIDWFLFIWMENPSLFSLSNHRNGTKLNLFLF